MLLLKMALDSGYYPIKRNFEEKKGKQEGEGGKGQKERKRNVHYLLKNKSTTDSLAVIDDCFYYL